MVFKNKIEALSRKHLREDFCCGNNSLDIYISKMASQDLKRNAATIFVLVDELESEQPQAKVLGYYTLSTYSIDIKELNKDFAKGLPQYPQLPAILLGRLAVDSTQKRKGLGAALLFDALNKSLEASKNIASLVVIAEAIDEQAAQFYLKYGFKRFNHQPTKLYYPIKSIQPNIDTQST